VVIQKWIPMTGLWRDRLSLEIDKVKELCCPPEDQSLHSLVDWQTELKNSVANLVSMRCESQFAKELFERMEGQQGVSSFEHKKEVCKWANSKLKAMGMFLQADGSCIGFLTASKARPSDQGRIYLEEVATGRRFKNISSVVQLNLVPGEHRVRHDKNTGQAR
jgi:hypothetical protein